MNENNLVNKVWDFAGILRDAGVNYLDYVAQITYLLFLKMDMERTTLLNEKSLLPENCQFSCLTSISGGELKTTYSKILETLSKEKGIIGTIFAEAQNKISEPANLAKLVSLINSTEWLGLDIDVKGAIYEGLLQKNATETKGGAGQYFTPRPLIKTIVNVMNLKPNLTVCDPACGTGGFIINAYLKMKSLTKDKQTIEKLKTEKLYGADITPFVVSLCAMNLYLHGIHTANIDTCDSLLNAGTMRYDIVLTNPPFGKKSSKTMGNGKDKEIYNREDFITTSSNKQINFLQHIMTILNTNGRCGVVLPDNVLFEGSHGETVRKKLLNEFNLHTILRLPTGIFYAQGVKANVLFFDKYPPLKNDHRTKYVWIYDLRTNMNITLVENSLNDTHLEDFEKSFNPSNIEKRQESERFKKFSYEEIIKRDKTNLDIFWLKDETIEDVTTLPAPDIITEEIIENIQNALEIFKNVRKELM